MMNQRVLVYSPYSSWWLHTLYDITIGHALRLRGSDVKFLCCDGVFSDCDIAWAAVRPRNGETCLKCMGFKEQVFSALHAPAEWLGAYIDPLVREEAKQWAASIPDRSLPDATFRGYPLGQWVRSSLHSHWRMARLDLEDPKVIVAYRSYLQSGALALDGLQKVFATFKPDAIVMMNGRFFSHRIALELAYEHGAKAVIHERGYRDDTLSIFEDEDCHGQRTFKASWERWRSVPLQKDQCDAVEKLFLEREFGKNTGWKPVKWDAEKSANLRQALSIPPGKRIISLFNSSQDEIAAAGTIKSAIGQHEWLKRTIAYVRTHPELFLIIRAHPNLVGHVGRNQQELAELADACSDLPDNVRLIGPEEPISSYQVVYLSDACLVYISTVGLEAAIRGKPVLLCGGGPYSGYEFAENLETGDGFEAQLSKLLEQRATTEQRRSAYRFGYHKFLRRSLPFPPVRVVEVHNGEVTYRSIDELAPGRFPTLDAICRTIQHGIPVDPGPSPDIEHSSSEENQCLSRPFPGAPAVEIAPAEEPTLLQSLLG